MVAVSVVLLLWRSWPVRVVMEVLPVQCAATHSYIIALDFVLKRVFNFSESKIFFILENIFNILWTIIFLEYIFKMDCLEQI